MALTLTLMEKARLTVCHLLREHYSALYKTKRGTLDREIHGLAQSVEAYRETMNKWALKRRGRQMRT